MKKMEVVIITGLSGSGKTNAFTWFEDQGYYCIDNMPPALIDNFLELCEGINKENKKAAFVIDIRGGMFFEDLNKCIDKLKKREDINLKILFMEASDSTLIKRYDETRRNHPLTTGVITKDVIQKEKELLRDVRKRADFVIDTTSMKVATLKLEIERLIGGYEKSSAFSINIFSFGYKHGVPIEADLLFDMRFIPNPYYVPSLKKLTGNNKKVFQYVMKQDITKSFIESFHNMLNELIPHYIEEGKYHLNIGFGCTGGQHRSVAMANKMAEIFKQDGYRVTLEHRDL